MRAIVAITIAAIVVVTGAGASAQSGGASPFTPAYQRYAELFNKADAAGVTAIYTDDATLVGANGIVHGRADIQKNREATFAAGFRDLSIQEVSHRVETNTGW